MPKNPPNPTYIFRMIHFKNIEYVLTNGMYHKGHEKADPNYVNIGDPGLIKDRNDYDIKIDHPGGKLGEYVPFYFAGHSPMLYQIKTGYRVAQIPQKDIIFVCCDIEDVIRACDKWCFTDGHAKNNMSNFYNDIKELSNIDWDAVNAQMWNNTADDFDRQRKKQAEFLVKYHVPINCIKAVIVKSEEKKRQVENIISKLKLEIPVKVDIHNKLYYHD